MCIAIAQPAGVSISKATLNTCFQRNSDGAGFMYCDDKGDVQVRKPFFKFKEFYRAFRQAEHDNPKSPFGIHFRIATSGNVDKENSHPHRIDRKMAVMHNGILSFVVPKDSKKSDTVMFTEGVFKQLPTNFELFPGILWLLEKYLGYGNKMVVLKGDGKFVILNESAGHWYEGAWYSNYTYKPLSDSISSSCGSGGNSYRFPGHGNYYSMGDGVVVESSSKGDYSVYKNRPWCRLCLEDLATDERGPNCDVCREVQRLTYDALNYPRSTRLRADEVVDRAMEVDAKVQKRLETLNKKEFKVTSKRLTEALEDMAAAIKAAIGGDEDDLLAVKELVMGVKKEADNTVSAANMSYPLTNPKRLKLAASNGNVIDAEVVVGGGKSAAAPGGPSLGNDDDEDTDSEGGPAIVRAFEAIGSGCGMEEN